jgi:hypothetical protein
MTDAPAGLSVDDLAVASAAAGVTTSLTGDWIASSCKGGSEAAGSTGAVPGVAAPEVTPGVAPEDAVAGDAEGDDGLPGAPVFSGLFSLMTVRQAPSTRTNEYALIIR